MSRFRNHLPQLDGGLWLLDGGMETTLVFLDGVDLPHFAAFDLLKTDAGTDRLRAYYALYAEMACRERMGFILESPTWRANPDWADRLGYDLPALDAMNRKAIALMVEIRDRFLAKNVPIVISGCIGPRGDGYDPGNVDTAESYDAYHRTQIETFHATEADVVTAMTINTVNEAIGIARAAKAVGMPSVISFTLETDGRLPTGETLRQAIMDVDAATGSAPAYYMINCVHPDHFDGVLEAGAGWTRRLRGIRANASRMSHAELDAAPELDAGNPVELGEQYREILARHPQINVIGGCCGTDDRHIGAICSACKIAA